MGRVWRFPPWWHVTIKSGISRLPKNILKLMVLLTQVRIQSFNLPEVRKLVVLQLEPGWLLPQPTEAERVLIRLVQNIGAD